MSMPRDTRVRLSAAAAFAVVFAGGIAVGFAFDREMSNPTEPGGVVATSDSKKENDSAPNGWIIDQIQLSEEQRSEVDSVLKYYGKRMTELQKSFHPRYRALVDSTNQSLRALLSEEQIARYDALEAERKAQHMRQNSSTPSQPDTTAAAP